MRYGYIRTVEVSLECAGERSAVDCQGLFYSCLVTHSLRHTVATHLIEVWKVLIQSSRLKLATVPIYQANDRSASRLPMLGPPLLYLPMT